MTKRNAIVLALLVGVLAVAAPIVATLYLARRQSIASEMIAAGAVATELLRRADETGDQSAKAVAKLKSSPSSDPCSPAKVELMAALAVASEQLQAVGYVSNNQLVCSSLGSYGSLLPIGLPDYVSANGTWVRSGVALPLVADKRFVILTTERNGYGVVIDPSLMLDVPVPNANTSLGIYAVSTRRLLTGRGYSDPNWVDELGRERRKSFTLGDHLVSLNRSPKGDFVAFAAMPVSNVDPVLRREAATLVPIGIVAGLALASAVLYLARIQLALPAVLKSALRRGEFFVVYQPVVNLRTRRWVGAEVLVRWRRPGGETVRPDLFIPVAEEAGLIHRLTTQIFEMVGREAATLFDRHPDFHLSINLASADLADPDTVNLVVGLLSSTRAAKGNLVVEATERGLFKTDITQRLLAEIRSRGVQVAIDDFGTGYSSLAYLQTFPIDILKIDKSFVDTIGIDAATSQVIFHIIRMSKALSLTMIAEGVETEAQATVLRDQGVESAQGMLFAAPMPFRDLIHHLDAAGSFPNAV